MLRFSGNSISAVIPMMLYLVNDSNNAVQFLDAHNNVIENPKLQTLVLNDIQASGSGVAALGASKRYYVDGITYAVDFTRFT
jgi:hypothetical protein